MNGSPETSLVVANGNDEVPGALTPPPDSDINFADDPDSRHWLDVNVASLLNIVRGEYTAQHESWGDIRRMGNLTRDNNAAYEGKSQAYLPIYQSARETKVSHISQGLFPSDTYIDARSVIPDISPELEQTVKQWMMFHLEQSMRLRAELKPWLRNLLDYGLSVGKVWWEKPPVPQRQTKLKRLPGIESMLLDYAPAPSFSNEGPRFKARNIFSWYVWPVSVNSIEEASIVFEDIQVSKQFVDEMASRKLWCNVEQALAGGNFPDSNTRIQEQLAEVANMTTAASNYQAGDLANWRTLTECWFRMPVPAALYRPGETVGSAVPVKVIFVGSIPVEARRNPFWHQQPPYVMRRINEVPDSFFSTGMGRTVSSLQYLANDFMNQTNDNGIYGLNPIIKYNPNLVVGPLEPLEPGRMFALTDPAGMVFDRPPIEQMQYGLMLTNQLISYANDFGGAPNVLQGSGSKGGAKTATGAQILQSNAKGGLQDIIEDIELCVLEPMMRMVASLGQQYESAERYMAISGGQKIQFKRDMLEAEFAFRWVASSQAVNRQQRAQAAVQFAQLAAQLVPLLQMQGKMFNPVPALRGLWEDGLGQRNFDALIVPAQQNPAGMQPPAASGPQPEAGQDPRSTVEQAPGGEAGMMAPGEGEAFGEVRQEADQLSALMGGQQ